MVRTDDFSRQSYTIDRKNKLQRTDNREHKTDIGSNHLFNNSIHYPHAYKLELEFLRLLILASKIFEIA